MAFALELERITVAYQGDAVVHDLTLRVEPQTIASLLGPSGSGKTTVLRAIAGFEPLQGGQIRIDGVVVSAVGRTLPPERRQVGVVFQDYALFPHLDVGANIAFGLKRWNKAARAARVAELLELVRLDGAADAYPHELSGGQQQRVALARALAPRPRLILIDEPFSNLDSVLRESLGLEVRHILKDAGTTAVLVTHDQTEAFVMADRIGVLHRGMLQQWADARSLYEAPANAFVAKFVGQGVLLEGRVRADGAVETALGIVSSGSAVAGPRAGDRVRVLIRPEQVALETGGSPNAVLEDLSYRGERWLYRLRLADGSQVLAFGREGTATPGTELRVTLVGRPAILDA